MFSLGTSWDGMIPSLFLRSVWLGGYVHSYFLFGRRDEKKGRNRCHFNFNTVTVVSGSHSLWS